MLKSSFPTKPLARLQGHNGPVHAVTFSSGSGQYILTGSQDRCVRLFNPSTNHLIQTYRAHGYEVLSVSVATDNRSFVSAGGDKTVFLWDVETAQAVRRFTGHTQRINACAFGGLEDSVVVSGSFDGSVKIWDVRARGADHRAVMTLSEARDAVSDVFVLREEIFAASVDGRVRVYDLRSGMMDVDVVAPGKGVTSVMPSQAGDGYLVTCLDSKVRFMDRGNGRCLQTCEGGGFKNDVYRVRATMAMGDAVALCGSEDGHVFVWDILTGDVLQKLQHRQAGSGSAPGIASSTASTATTKSNVVSAVAWNQLRKQWASAGGDGTVVIWG